MPSPAADEVMIRVQAVGLCGSDAHYFREGRIGPYVVDSPLVLGHETSGTVVAVGAAVKHLNVGDLVAVEPGVPCGSCEWCRSGHYNLCPDIVFHATPPVDGTLQEYVTVRSDFAFHLPSGLGAEQGALVEPLSVAVWACRKANIGRGMLVLVTGAGTVGILTMQVARVLGAAEVTLTDVDEAKLDLAAQLGATHTLHADALTGDDPTYDVHMECSGNAAAAAQGVRRLRPRGTSVIVGMGADEVALPVPLLQGRELTITGLFRYADCYPTAIEMLQRGDVKVDALVTQRFPLADTETAIRTSGAPGVMRNLVVPSE